MRAAELFDISGKVAVVTGASRGIGAGTGRLLASAGARVALTYHNDKENAEALASEINGSPGADDLGAANPRAANPRARVYHLDVSDSASVTRAFDAVAADFGGVDILVNNSGAYPHTDALGMPESEWDAVFDVNAKGTFLCSREAAARMKAAGTGGKIINISSIAALQPERAFSHYAASKGAVISLTKSLALEWASLGITVNAVLPGLIDIGGLHEFVPERAKAYETLAPMHRAGQPQDIAGVVLFLSSKAADFVTGQTVVVDGGALLAGYMELARNEPGAPSE